MEDNITTTLKADPGRKYRLTTRTILIVLALGIGGELLKRFAGIDQTELIKWAMAMVTTAGFGGSATIAYEDSHRPAAKPLTPID